MGDIFSFFVGCARSGTTLIRVMFDSHSQLSIPRESHFITELAGNRDRYEAGSSFDTAAFLTDLTGHYRYKRWKMPEDKVRAALTDPPPADYPDAIRRLYALHATMEGKPRYGDKTPGYCMELPLLSGMFPEGRFVHVIRDGRDVALSLLESPFGPQRIDRAAIFWRKRIEKARKAAKQLGPSRYYEYHHEALVADPQGVLTGLCEFLDLQFEEGMLQYYQARPQPTEDFFKEFPHVRNITKPPTKTRDWRDQMDPEDVKLFETLAGDVLEECGYERATSAALLSKKERAELDRKARAAQRRDQVRGSKAYNAAIKLKPVRALADAYKKTPLYKKSPGAEVGNEAKAARDKKRSPQKP